MIKTPSVKNPIFSRDCKHKVVRGGSYLSFNIQLTSYRTLRSGERFTSYIITGYTNRGFRLNLKKKG